MSSTVRDRLLPWGVLLLSLLLFAPGLLIGGEIPFSRDAAGLYQPLWQYVGSRFQQGELPLWFPYEGLGVPVVESTVSGIFHPFSALLLVMSSAQAMRVEALLCFAIAFVATWSLARRLGAPLWAAAMAAEVYAFSGSFVGLLNNSVYLRGAAFFPLVLLGLQVAMSHRVRGVMLAGFAWGCILLAGEIQTAYLSALIGLGFVFALRPATLSRGHALFTFALSGLVAGALAAVQVLPTLRNFASTDRGAGLEVSEASRWSLHPIRLLDVFLGDGVRWTMGATELNAVREHVLQTDSLWSPTVYVSALTLVGSLFALALSRGATRRLSWSLAVMAGLLLWLSLGTAGGLASIAWKVVPLWSAFRFPEKLVLHAALLLALLAAIGWGLAAREENRAAALRAGRWIFIGAAGLGLLLLIGMVTSAGALALYFQQLLPVAIVSLILCVLCFTAVVGVGPFWKELKPSVRALTVPASALVLLYVVNARVIESSLGPDWAPEAPSPVVEALQRHGPSLGRYRVQSAFSNDGRLEVPGREWPPSITLALWQRVMLQPDHSAGYDIETPGRLLPAVPTRFKLLQKHTDDPALVPLFNTRFLLTSQEDQRYFTALPTRVASTFPALGAVLLELDTALPRAFFAQPLPAKNVDEALSQVLSPDVRTGRKAVVEGVTATPQPGEGRVETLSYEPERVELKVQATQPGVVVLNDTWDANWIADVDGTPQPVLHANVLVRAVEVPAGEHRVVFRYPVPTSIRVGAIVSGITALVLAVLAVWQWRARHLLRTA